MSRMVTQQNQQIVLMGSKAGDLNYCCYTDSNNGLIQSEA